MTEEEAKTKWCPMISSDNDSFPSFLSRKENPDNWVKGMCIGSDCMAWRWGRDTYQKIPCEECAGTGKDRKGQRPHCFYCDGAREVSDIDHPIKQGYCGLAGKP